MRMCVCVAVCLVYELYKVDPCGHLCCATRKRSGSRHMCVCVCVIYGTMMDGAGMVFVWGNPESW